MKEVGVGVGSWAPGMPSTNRSANCLVINRYGNFMEEACHSSGRYYHTLCEAQSFYHGHPGEPDVSDIKISYDDNQDDDDDATINDELFKEQRQAFFLIGTVGNTMYFADNQSVSLV